MLDQVAGAQVVVDGPSERRSGSGGSSGGSLGSGGSSGGNSGTGYMLIEWLGAN